MELWEKAMRLESFIRNYTPSNFREPIHVFMFSPSVSEDNYKFFEQSYNKGTLDKDLLAYSDMAWVNMKPIIRFKTWYIIAAIKEYFEKDSVELRERECKHCGATTIRTDMGLCSKCGKFN